MQTAIVLLVIDWVLVGLAAGLTLFSFPTSAKGVRPDPAPEWRGWMPNLVALEPYIAMVAAIWAFATDIVITVFLPPYSTLSGGAFMGNPVILQTLFLTAMAIIIAVNAWQPFNTHGWNTKPAGPALTVFSLNCRYGKADAAQIVQTVRAHDVDALCLMEVSDGLLRRLEAAGIGDLLPYRVTGEKGDDDNGGFNAVLTHGKPVAQVRASMDLKASDVPVAVVPLPAGVKNAADDAAKNTVNGSSPALEPVLVTIAAAHTKSPQRGVRDWGYGVAHLANPALSPAVQDAVQKAAPAAATDPALAVLAGDLNASASHRSFRFALGTDRRLADSSDDLAHRRTFPSNWALIPPMLELDHVLHGPGLVARSLETVRVAGTDHRGLLVRLEKI